MVTQPHSEADFLLYCWVVEIAGRCRRVHPDPKGGCRARVCVSSPLTPQKRPIAPALGNQCVTAHSGHHSERALPSGIVRRVNAHLSGGVDIARSSQRSVSSRSMIHAPARPGATPQVFAYSLNCRRSATVKKWAVIFVSPLFPLMIRAPVETSFASW